jgi:hypothetical protein
MGIAHGRSNAAKAHTNINAIISFCGLVVRTVQSKRIVKFLDNIS